MKKIIKKIVIKFNLITIISLIYYFFRFFKIKKNKVFCQNFTSGKGVGDSPKYIAMSLLNDKKNNYDIVWAVKKNDYQNVPKGIRLVKIYSLKYFYEMSTAKIWITNTRFPQFVKKRKKQYYIQTWHSPLRLKKIELDAYDKMSEYYKKCMKNDSKMIDVILSGCKFSTNIYKNSFMYSGDILEIGTPRCDMFFNKNKNEAILKKISNKYNIKNKKIILYAPTFRKNSESNEYLLNFKKIDEELGHEYKILVRSHPSTKIIFNKSNNIVDVSDYPDMQDLVSCSDILITDYSSCCFDMMIANKPCFLLTKDLDHYLKNERGLYFSFEELPFYISKTDDELIEMIINFDREYYEKRVNLFKNKIGLAERGDSSEKICRIIKGKCFGEN